MQECKEVVGLGSQLTCLQELLLLGCDLLSQCLGLGDVVSLQQLDVVRCSQLSQIPDLHKLTKLRWLNIWGTKVTKLLGLNNSMPLLELVVCGTEIEELPNLDVLRHLQRLHMSIIMPMVMPQFDSLIALEELILKDLPEVRDIHGMRSLTRLKRLTIIKAPKLLQIPELGDLIALQYLNLHVCCSLVENLDLPDLHNLINLEVLEIIKTPIRRLPSLECLTQLRGLCCYGTLLTELPILNGLDKLGWINLTECRELTSLENVGTLPALIRLDVSCCSSLTRLPNIRSCRSLEFLCIWGSRVSLGPEDITALANLPALEMRSWDYAEVHLSELLEEMSMVEVVLHLEVMKREYISRLLSSSEMCTSRKTLTTITKKLTKNVDAILYPWLRCLGQYLTKNC